MEPLRRSLHGERGLKMDALMTAVDGLKGRSLHGERGLKIKGVQGEDSHLGRSLHGERGLKIVLPIHFLRIKGRSPCGSVD